MDIYQSGMVVGMSKVSRRFSITIMNDTKKFLEVKPKDEVIFFQLPDNKEVFITTGMMQGGELVLGTSMVSRQFAFVMPKKVRTLLKVEIGYRIQYWFVTDRRIRLVVVPWQRFD